MKKLFSMSLFILLAFSVAALAADRTLPARQAAPARSAPAKSAPAATSQKAIKPVTPIVRTKITPPDEREIQILRGSNTIDPAPKPFRITACTLPDGNVFLGWEVFAQMTGQSYPGRAARGGKYNPANLTRIGGEMMYSNARNSYFLTYNRAMAFANGNVLTAYNDEYDYTTSKGTLVILTPDMRVKAGPVHFCQTKVRDIALAAIPGGQAILVAYCDEKADRGKGKYVIVDPDGKLLVEPTAFTNKYGLSMFSAGTTSDGLVMIAFNGHEPNGPLTGSSNIVIDGYGNVVRPLRSFWNYKTIGGLQICPLSNGTVLAAGNWNGKACCFVVDNQNSKPVHDFKPFYNSAVSEIQLTRLDDDRVFISFCLPAEYKAMCTVVDATGTVVKDPIPVPICPEYKIQADLRTVAQTRLNDNSVLIFAHGFKETDGGKMISAWYVMR